MNVAALILGVVGITGWILMVFHMGLTFIPFTSALLAIILGVVASKKAKVEGKPKGMGIAGVILGLIGLILLPILGFLYFYMTKEALPFGQSSSESYMPSISSPSERTPDQPQQLNVAPSQKP